MTDLPPRCCGRCTWWPHYVPLIVAPMLGGCGCPLASETYQALMHRADGKECPYFEAKEPPCQGKE